MNSISIQYDLATSSSATTAATATATVTETIRSGSMLVRKGVDEKGGSFVTVDQPGDRIILITRLSSGAMLMDAI